MSSEDEVDLGLEQDPVILKVNEEGYLVDPRGGADLPSRREGMKFGDSYGDELTLAEIRGFLLEDGQIDEEDERANSDQALDAWLDEEASPDELSEVLVAERSEFGLGLHVLEWLSEVDAPLDGSQGFELTLVDGQFPGDDFIAVHFEGSPKEFNVFMRGAGQPYRIVP